MAKALLFVGHSGCGKTTLCERILFNQKITSRLGRTDEGTSILDYDPEEQERKITINLGIAHFENKGEKIFLLDCPGFIDFQGEFLSGIHITDIVCLVISASGGVEVGTEIYGEKVFERSIPAAVFITKMKSENVNIKEVLKVLRNTFEKKFVLLTFPIGEGESFMGVKTIFEEAPEGWTKEKEETMESIVELDENLVEKYLEKGEISPSEIKYAIKKGIKEGLIVPVFFGDSLDDKGINEFIEFVTEFFPSYNELIPRKGRTKDGKEVEISPAEDGSSVGFVFKTMSDPHLGEINYIRVLRGSIKTGTELLNPKREIREKITSLYHVLGKERKEINELKTGEIGAIVKLKDTHTNDTLCSIDDVVIYPEIDFPWRSVQVAVIPKTKQDEEKVSEALKKLAAEDSTFSFHYNPELKQTIIEGLGEIHLNVIVSKMKRRYGVEVTQTKPKIPYRETIRKKAEAMGKYVKQSGGRGQYGICNIRIEPLPRGKEYEFINSIFGGAIPSNFIPSVETGIKKAMQSGVLAGFPVIDVRVELYDGKYHPVDSSNIAFEIAGSMAFRDAQMNADSYLLEPIYEVEVIVPEEIMGDVMSDLNSRRGRILGMEPIGKKKQKIKAYVPLAELYGYSSSLRSIAKGKAVYFAKFSHYDEVPKELAQKIIEQARKEKET
ncbi:MAG: elongation factor G [Candidatus Hydrothermales bacterium]